MIFALIAVNTAGWLVLQLSIAAMVTRMSSRYFASDNRISRVRRWEIDVYRRWLQIHRWKGMLPDAALWVGGTFSKKTLERRDPPYLRQFASETRRGETAHWLMLACFPLFFLWNPPAAWIVIVLYAAGANLPCILVQRHNRQRLRRLLMHGRGASPIGQSKDISRPAIEAISPDS